MRRDLPTTVRGLLGLGIAVVLFGLVYVGVTFAYGGYDDDYALVADFPRAGQGLANGSEVSYRGVAVGEVQSVELVDRQARVTLAMDPGFEVPVDARFVVRPKTIFGEKFVDLTFPEGAHGPYLDDGDTVEHADSATEVEDFFEGSDNLFAAIDENELAELVTSLNDAARGTGDDVARAFESSADASAVGADTIDAQLRALDSFATFQDAIASIGPDLNTISANNEIALGEFNANRPAFERVLSSLRPFAEDLAALLAGTRPDIDTYLERGDSVVRLLTANEGHLTEVINGLGQYVQAFGGGLSQERLPDGSGFAYFKNFIYLDDVEAFLCSQLADAPEEFGGLRDALLSLQSDFDCSGYYEPSSEAGPPAPAQLPSAARQAAAARRLVDQLYGLLGSPQVARDQDLSTLLDGLLGQGVAP
ncbi:MAG TPA: MCE family protein [Acidimicrobiales bacterium]